MDKQLLISKLGASVVISGTDSMFLRPRLRRQAGPGALPSVSNDFGDAVRTLLSGSTSLAACITVD